MSDGEAEYDSGRPRMVVVIDMVFTIVGDGLLNDEEVLIEIACRVEYGMQPGSTLSGGFVMMDSAEECE